MIPHPGFQVRGGALKKIAPSGGRREKFGVFRVKNHDFTSTNHIFSNFRGDPLPPKIGKNMMRPPGSASGIGGVMVSVLGSSAVDRGFEPQSGETKECENVFFCLSDK